MVMSSAVHRLSALVIRFCSLGGAEPATAGAAAYCTNSTLVFEYMSLKTRSWCTQRSLLNNVLPMIQKWSMIQNYTQHVREHCTHVLTVADGTGALGWGITIFRNMRGKGWRAGDHGGDVVPYAAQLQHG